MSNLKDTFNKQGGLNLIKQYWQSGAFFTAVGEFFLLGKSRTALEILRLSTHLKAKQKLEKKYKQCLKNFDSHWIEPSHQLSNKVWICWFQGINNAPEIVQRCYESVKINMQDKDIVLITENNMLDYVDFPDYILDKWKNGKISNTHMTDLLRLELLIKYGGMWLDATVYCSGSDIPEYFFKSELFMFQSLKPGRDGHSHITSSWLISAKSNNKILMAVRSLCYEYWKTHDSLIDYFLLHDFMAIALEYYESEWKKIIPRDNATPHILLLRLFDRYDDKIWNAIKAQTPFHKLTYKFEKEKTEMQGTYYSEIIRRE